MAEYLVIQLARFGDVLQTKRLMRALLAREDAVVHLCVDRSLQEIARLVYPEAKIHGLAAHAVGERLDEALLLKEIRKSFAALREIDPAEVYNLNYSGFNFALSTLFEPSRVRGYRLENGQQLKSRWSELAFRWTQRRASSPINLVDFWAGFGPPLFPANQVNPPARGGAKKGHGLGLVLAGRNSRRSLPPDALAPIVRAALRQCDTGKVFLLGSSAETPAARNFMRRADTGLRSCLRDLTGQTDWRQLVDVVADLELLLTPDTGVMHLAAHLGTPILAFFLSSAWAWETGPYGEGHRIWQAVHDCAPCVESQPCPCELACLAPFQSREFLRLTAQPELIETPSNAVNGLVLLESGFDELGAVYRPKLGRAPWETERAGLRRLAAEVQGVRLDPDAPVDENLFRERDWMTLSDV